MTDLEARVLKLEQERKVDSEYLTRVTLYMSEIVTQFRQELNELDYIQGMHQTLIERLLSKFEAHNDYICHLVSDYNLRKVNKDISNLN